MRRLLSSVLPVMILAGLTGGCEVKPLPSDKLDYAGHWRGEDVDLVIGLDGRVQFKKLVGGKGQVNISGPIAQWIDEDFIVGVMVVKTKFDVSVPPHKSGNNWLMTVDDVLLVRDETSGD